MQFLKKKKEVDFCCCTRKKEEVRIPFKNETPQTNVHKKKMADNQKKMKTLAKQKATTICDLYSDCLLSILAFIHPLEIWFQRLTCSRWHAVVPVALARVVQIDGIWTCDCTEMIFSEQEKNSSNVVHHSSYIRQVAHLCPNLIHMCFRVPKTVQNFTICQFNYKKKIINSQ